MKKNKISVVIVLLISATTYAQNVGVNSTGVAPRNCAMLDILSSNTGLLIPTLALTNVATYAPCTGTAVDGLLVYSSAAPTGGAGTGYYYWSTASSTWVALSGNTSKNWALLGNTGTNDPAVPGTYGTSTFGATENWLGTTDANDLTFGTNNIERMRIKQTTGNVGIGIAAPTSLLHIVDAKLAVTTGTLATITGNALTTGTGLLIQSSSLTSGKLVDIEVTNATATGPALNISNAGQTGNAITATGGGAVNYSAIFASNAPTANGTGFDISLSSHTIAGQINLSAANSNYGFAVLGEVISHAEPCGGVMGVISGETWGALAYHAIAGGATYYGGYFNTAIQNVGGGRMSNNGNQNNATSVGIGAYGDLFGGWVRGNVYGMAIKGDRVSLYVDGKTIVNQPIIQLSKNADNKTIVNYTPASATADLQMHGVAKMENGIAVVLLNAETLSQFISPEDLTIIATPTGQTNGVYAELKGSELLIKENNGGKSGTKVSWIIIGQRNVTDSTLPDEFKDKNFDTNLESFMHNENDNSTQGGNLWWDGQKLNTNNPPRQPK